MKNTPFQQNTKGITRFHLTFTGIDAGTRYCGAEKKEGEQSFHAIYAPDEAFEDPRMCPDCLAFWNTGEIA